jgi:hypothetical protein
MARVLMRLANLVTTLLEFSEISLENHQNFGG